MRKFNTTKVIMYIIFGFGFLQISLLAMLQRINADRELEVATLNRELQTHQLIIKDSVDAGDVLLEDLDALKRQAKSMPCTLNWAKFKVKHLIR